MKKIWYFITILIISALLINVISADNTYITLSSNTCYTTAKNGNWIQHKIFSTDVRAVTIKSNDTMAQYFISNSPFNYRLDSDNSTACTLTNPTTQASSYNYNGNTYSYVTTSYSYTNGEGYENIPVQEIQNNNALETAIYYTYGEGADTTPTYGELIINYAQDIRTTGNGSDNLDLITWNAYRDTAGNDLQGLNIEIQAIAGYFEGSSYADLKTSLFSDWQASTHPSVTMYKGDIEQSHQEYTWEEVAYNFRSINTLGTWFWNIFADNDTWYQYGWRYQARLLDEDLEPLTEWQTLYTGNSYTPSATETFTDDEPLTPDDVETINDINEQNGTTNNWYINNTVINNNEYNQTWQQNIIENIYNILQGTPDPVEQQHATDVQNTIDNAIDQEDNYINDLETQLHDLQLPDISENNGLMKALRWIRELHHETIEETQLGTVVLVTMIIGLVTYLIGRRNG